MSKQVQDAYVVAATRLPIGKSGRGYFKNTRPDEMLVKVMQAVLAQAPGLDPAAIEDAIVGCSFPEGEQGMNIARVASVLAGLGPTIGGVTINRYCASGITAVQMAADRIRVGEADVMFAGGVESMSMIPMGGNKPSLSPLIFERDENIGIAYGMGLTAEKVAAQWKISREAQDEFSVESHRRAVAAMAAGHFDAEMTPFDVVERTPNLLDGTVNTKTRTVKLDEGARPDTSLEGLAKLKPVFAAKGSVTAGNSSQTSDGSGGLLIVSEAALKRFNLTPLARFVSFAVRGVPPEIMGIGPIEAIPAALKAAGITAADLDWIELNEAFAAQSLAVLNDLDSKGITLDRSKVNPNGGAIALGHPLGATGAIRAAVGVDLAAVQRDALAVEVVQHGQALSREGLVQPQPAPHRRQVRHGDDVRRRRPRRRRHFRASVSHGPPPRAENHDGAVRGGPAVGLHREAEDFHELEGRPAGRVGSAVLTQGRAGQPVEPEPGGAAPGAEHRVLDAGLSCAEGGVVPLVHRLGRVRRLQRARHDEPRPRRAPARPRSMHHRSSGPRCSACWTRWTPSRDSTVRCGLISPTAS
jgi:acetyl-CoA acyltransferase